jgi:hypothetical protein
MQVRGYHKVCKRMSASTVRGSSISPGEVWDMEGMYPVKNMKYRIWGRPLIHRSSDVVRKTTVLNPDSMSQLLKLTAQCDRAIEREVDNRSFKLSPTLRSI